VTERLAAVVRSEWTKLWSVRSTVWTLLTGGVIAVVAGALAAAGNAHSYEQQSPARRAAISAGFDALAKSFNGFLIVQLAMGILGVLSLGAEYGSGSIRGTLAAVPRRPSLLAGKAVVIGVVGLVTGELTALVPFVVAQAFLAPAHLAVALGDPGVARGVLAAGWYLAVGSLLGLGFAALTRNTAAAIGALVLVQLILPQIAAALPRPWNDDFGRLLAPNAAQQLASLRPDPQWLAPLPAFLTCCAWALVVLVGGGIVLTRRDA
jgi:hypothetical protein